MPRQVGDRVKYTKDGVQQVGMITGVYVRYGVSTEDDDVEICESEIDDETP